MPQHRKYSSSAERQAAYRNRQAEVRAASLEGCGLPSLPTIPSVPGAARWSAALLCAYRLMDRVIDEMQAYYDERSEEWRGSECGDAFEARRQEIDDLKWRLSPLVD